jgi:catechol 2,3-dioxygenase-like lactoylglutathione lyase family enzyme
MGTSPEQTGPFEMKLEVVPVPVADLDRAKAFYEQQLGFHVDYDVTITSDRRIVQLTPPGSGCSIVFTIGFGAMSEMQVGSLKGLHLVVEEIEAVRAWFVERGVEISEIQEDRGVKYASFSDPDGNAWVLQYLPPHMRGG